MATQTGGGSAGGGDADAGDMAVACFATADAAKLAALPELAILIRALTATPGVQSAQFSPNKPHVLVVQYRPAEIDPAQLLRLLQGNSREFRQIEC